MLNRIRSTEMQRSFIKELDEMSLSRARVKLIDSETVEITYGYYPTLTVPFDEVIDYYMRVARFVGASVLLSLPFSPMSDGFLYYSNLLWNTVTGFTYGRLREKEYEDIRRVEDMRLERIAAIIERVTGEHVGWEDYDNDGELTFYWTAACRRINHKEMMEKFFSRRIFPGEAIAFHQVDSLCWKTMTAVPGMHVSYQAPSDMCYFTFEMTDGASIKKYEISCKSILFFDGLMMAYDMLFSEGQSPATVHLERRYLMASLRARSRVAWLMNKMVEGEWRQEIDMYGMTKVTNGFDSITVRAAMLMIKYPKQTQATKLGGLCWWFNNYQDRFHLHYGRESGVFRLTDNTNSNSTVTCYARNLLDAIMVMCENSLLGYVSDGFVESFVFSEELDGDTLWEMAREPFDAVSTYFNRRMSGLPLGPSRPTVILEGATHFLPDAMAHMMFGWEVKKYVIRFNNDEDEDLEQLEPMSYQVARAKYHELMHFGQDAYIQKDGRR